MIKAIVTDIEGTTSSLSFVKDVLFPYAYEHLPTFLEQQAEQAAVREQLRQVEKLVGHSLTLAQAIDQLRLWIRQDQKITPLKALQGMIWEQGYARGDFHGHVYDDAVECLRHWQQQGIALYVYSSGSVHAQQLLFGHTAQGDLRPLFSGYFDTLIGGKMEAESYRHIIAELQLPPEQVLFLSDITAELDAAREAGMQTCQLVRAGALDGQTSHAQVSHFEDIKLCSASDD